MILRNPMLDHLLKDQSTLDLWSSEFFKSITKQIKVDLEDNND